MRTNEALEIIEKGQMNMCHIGQSVLNRNKDGFSKETIETVKKLTHDAVHCLGAIKQEVYRFIQNIDDVKISCNYSIEKPISYSWETGDIKMVQNRILKMLSDYNAQLKTITLGNLVSSTDNRTFKLNDTFKKEMNNFDEIVNKFSETILNDKNVLPETKVEVSPQTEEEKKTQSNTTTNQPVGGSETETKHTLSEEDMKNNPELSANGLKAGDEVLIPKETVTNVDEQKTTVTTEEKDPRES